MMTVILNLKNFKQNMADSLYIETLKIEVFKTHHGFSQVSFLDLFHNYNGNNFYSLRSKSEFQIPVINTTLK